MLSELTIRNFAIIDELNLTFNAGFNVMTGETGAGKSIILDAMMLILGGRADTSMVRAGSDSAFIEATFALSTMLQAFVNPLLEKEGLESDDDSSLMLARELRSNGRFLCRINGRTVTLNLLRQISEHLIDIHGQGEHLSLLKPRSHLPLLDAYGNLGSQRDAMAREVRQLRALQRELSELRDNEKNRLQREDFLTFRVREIDEANLSADEEEKLVAERNRLANSEQLLLNVHEAIKVLLGDDNDDAPNVIDLMGQVERALTQLTRLDPSKEALLTRLQGLSSEINDVAGEVEDYHGTLEFNPGRLTFVEERLETINHLKRKYGGTIEQILATAKEAHVELEKIGNSEARIEELERVEKRYLTKIGKLAEALSKKRRQAAKQLAKAAETELNDLGMDGARFQVDFQVEVDERGVPIGDQTLAYDQNGIDKVEFVISTNPGEPLKPMAKVASGGETARLMLALKTALARVDKTPTLIFDEIDQGIGGRIGAVVGNKLWSLTAHGTHQVIVVTHLPQLAGYGDAHMHVRKSTVEGRTTTSVATLEKDARIFELAEMLGTQADHAQKGAKSILDSAADEKRVIKQASR